MTSVANDKDQLLDLFAQFDNRWEEAPFESLRQAARQRFHELRFPGPKTEDWRFTNLAALRKTIFELAIDPPAVRPDLPPLPTSDTLRLVFVNGHLHSELSAKNIPAGVVVGSLAKHPEAEARLGETLEDADQIFAALNTSLVRDGAFISVAPGKAITAPIEIIHVTSSNRPLMTQPRVLALLGKNSQATIVERYLGAGAGANFTNAVCEFIVGEKAVLEHTKVQQETSRAFHIAVTQATLAAGANLTSHYLAMGGGLVRNETRVRFDGPHGEATVNGLYLGAGQQHLDNFTVIDHAQPNCASHELYKGILADQAHGVFNGKIFVRKDAQKTDAKQTNKVLLLSEQATINTKPQLEIFADDVKCTHGATIGQLDEAQIFYLRSRGIGLEEARGLLTYAFANDIIGRIKIEAIRAQLEETLVNRS